MKLRPIGIIPMNEGEPCNMKASDFSNKQYDGVQLRRTDKGTPAPGFCHLHDMMPLTR